MFNNHCKLKLFSMADTCFASTIVMLNRFKTRKRGLEQLVISEEWEMYKENDVVKAKDVRPLPPPGRGKEAQHGTGTLQPAFLTLVGPFHI